MDEEIKYVRCGACDSAVTIDQVRARKLNKVEGIKHEYVQYVCPCCDYEVKSFIFGGVEEWKGI